MGGRGEGGRKVGGMEAAVSALSRADLNADRALPNQAFISN